MDEIDLSIVKLIQANPNLTHSEIAKKIKRSQPTVGQRLKKLAKKGIVKYQAGFNFKEMDMLFANVYVLTHDSMGLIDTVKNCPYMLNAFKISGEFNFCVFLTAFSLKELELIVNYHFRKNPEVINTSIELITGIVDDFIMPFNLNLKSCKCGISHLLTKKE